ncbi:MAG: 30S ribosomal protein S18 [Clostridiales bacterium]|nr:30S ribosomal protein S18 [Clostridiales bacterium]
MAENRAPKAAGREFSGNMRQRRSRRKSCSFCAEKVEVIDFMDSVKLRKFVSERGKILPKRMTGTCAKHQRELTTAIKRARQIALLPYVAD